jgi:hypothetical protein
MFIKLGENIEISRIENTDSCIPAVNADILENFRKFAASLKKIAPKAEDFLYFSAVMMHAAEAAGYNDDGTSKLNARGETVNVGWDKSGGTWKWQTNDPSIKPYKNSNGDIFPEEELVKAYKKWIGKPLCVDHKSSSVDHVRGFIVDTYYDRSLKRVIALCALDKAGYPQLARQVSTGVSNCVSMGTAVGKAICTEANCHRVARMEQDFCSHMKAKSGYGEINVDLNPIELSIVVNGADPKASIKHIIAAANTLNTYVENKSQELNKIANMNYSATLSAENFSSGNDGKKTDVTIKATDLNQFRSELDDAFAKLENIKNSQKDTNDMASDQSESIADAPGADFGLAPPNDRYASANVDENTITELHMITKTIEAKLGQMKESLDKLTNTSTKNKQEETMSGTNDMNKKGYYQGAGGVNEPSPGQAKYPKDPLNEQLREKEDKQMVGQAPFPGVGPVDGVHPSPASADPSDELERKKMLARAEAEERAIRRQAIVDLAKSALQDKKAYIQGGGGVNEPTPGKVKYPADKLNEQLRDREDKQMVGQKPFPGVGAVDGMHPSPASADVPDEKKRKELLQRASLRARFVKAANSDGSQNLGKSAWEVFLGDKLLLTASVNELSGGRTEMLYESIATKEFGGKLIEKVKKEGADKVRSVIKTAQEAPAAPAAPPADMGAPEAEDKGKSGDPKESLLDLAEKARDLTSDVVEGVRALTGEQAEMGDVAAVGPEMGAAASFSTSTLNSLRKGLNGALTQAMKECVAELNGHQQELTDIAALYDNGGVTPTNSEFVGTIAEDAMGEAKTAIADGFKLMTAFVKYARGTQAIVKRAEIEAELDALSADDEGDTMNSDDDLMNLINETNDGLGEVNALMADDALPADGLDEADSLDGLDALDTLNLDGADDNDAVLSLNKGEQAPPGFVGEVKMASFDTKEGRHAMRAKLAADALGKQEDGEVQDMSKQKFSDMLDQADRLADGQTQLDTKPSDDLGLVETLPEVNKAMMELAKAPPNVRKEAEAIHKLVSAGMLDRNDVDELVAQGLDKDAAAYYKKYYGMVDGGSEFASELVKEHVKAQLEQEINGYKVKIARAYELAYDMVDRGLCHNDRAAVSSQVEDIMKYNDDSFASLKKVVARHAPTLRKEAGRMTQFGVIGSGDATSEDVKDDFSQLSDAFAQKTKRLF